MGCCSSRDENSLELNHEQNSLLLYEIETLSKHPNTILPNHINEELSQKEEHNNVQLQNNSPLNIIVPINLINRIINEEIKSRDEDEYSESESANLRNIEENEKFEEEDEDLEEDLEDSSEEGLTPSTINSLKLVIYNDKNLNKLEPNYENRNKNCSICIKDYENGEKIRYLPCKHSFHQNCVDYWLSLKNACPLCKGKIE